MKNPRDNFIGEVEFEVSKDFKNLFGEENLYESHVLNLMNKSKIIFPSTYRKVEKQSNGEPDFFDEKDGQPFDAKIVLSREECKRFFGENKIEDFVAKMIDKNDSLHDWIFDDQFEPKSLEEIIKLQLGKKSTSNKNIIFLFLLPMGFKYKNSIFSERPLQLFIDRISNQYNGRRIYGISPTFDGCFEVYESNTDQSEIIEYSGFDSFFKWRLKQ